MKEAVKQRVAVYTTLAAFLVGAGATARAHARANTRRITARDGQFIEHQGAQRERAIQLWHEAQKFQRDGAVA